MKQKRAPRPPLAEQIELVHAGTALSLRLRTSPDCFALNIFFETKGVTAETPDLVIPIEGDSPAHLCCPSVEGTVIWCQLKSGKHVFFDSMTGLQLATEKLKERQDVHFYS